MKFLCKKLFTGEIFVLILFCEEIMADEAGESCGAGGCAEKWGESRAFSDEDRVVLRRATKGGIFGERRTAVGGKGNKQSQKRCIGFRLGCFRLGRIQRDFCGYLEKGLEDFTVEKRKNEYNYYNKAASKKPAALFLW